MVSNCFLLKVLLVCIAHFKFGLQVVKDILTKKRSCSVHNFSKKVLILLAHVQLYMD